MRLLMSPNANEASFGPDFGPVGVRRAPLQRGCLRDADEVPFGFLQQDQLCSRLPDVTVDVTLQDSVGSLASQVSIQNTQGALGAGCLIFWQRFDSQEAFDAAVVDARSRVRPNHWNSRGTCGRNNRGVVHRGCSRIYLASARWHGYPTHSNRDGGRSQAPACAASACPWPAPSPGMAGKLSTTCCHLASSGCSIATSPWRRSTSARRTARARSAGRPAGRPPSRPEISALSRQPRRQPRPTALPGHRMLHAIVLVLEPGERLSPAPLLEAAKASQLDADRLKVQPVGRIDGVLPTPSGDVCDSLVAGKSCVLRSPARDAGCACGLSFTKDGSALHGSSSHRANHTV